MTIVEYSGRADRRVLSQAQLASVGFTVPGGIEWNRANNFRLDIDDPLLVAFLIAQGSTFQTEGEEDFVGLASVAFVTRGDFDAQGPSGRELDYAQSTAPQSTNNVATDINDCIVNFTVAARPVHVWGLVGGVACSVIGNVVIQLTDAANDIKSHNLSTSNPANEIGSVWVHERFDAPGEYTRKLRFLSSSATANSGNIMLAGYGKAVIYAIES